MSKHPCHSKQLPSLNRISGQIEGVKNMIDEGRYCPDILTQMRAIRSALKTVEGNILEKHLESCVTEAIEQQSKKSRTEKIHEVKELFKRYND